MAAVAATHAGQVNDVEVPHPPTDSISSLAFSQTADYLATGSWDNSVRIYEVGSNMQAQCKAMHTQQGAVLSVCWNKDGDKVFSAGADNVGIMFDVATGQTTRVAQHDAPVKAIKWIDTHHSSILITGSWDKTIRYWDLRSPSPIATLTLPERCYSLDFEYPLMVVGTADRHIQYFEFTTGNPTLPVGTIQSTLKFQTRVVSCFRGSMNTSKTGFAVGSVDGRIAIQYTDPKECVNNYTFRCHRKDIIPKSKNETIVYPINDISFHPIQGTFTTCSSDGNIYFWDKDARMRKGGLSPASGPITSTTFNRNGSILAYALSYDWHKGHSGMTADIPNKIFLHKCKDDAIRREVRRRR
ncbi:Poly(A)+ RNA export protein [Amanita muscaria]